MLNAVALMMDKTQKQNSDFSTRQITVTLDEDTWQLLEQCVKRTRVSEAELLSWSVKKGRDFCDYPALNRLARS
jgi:hypothetical protein